MGLPPRAAGARRDVRSTRRIATTDPMEEWTPIGRDERPDRTRYANAGVLLGCAAALVLSAPLPWIIVATPDHERVFRPSTTPALVVAIVPTAAAFVVAALVARGGGRRIPG